MPWTPKYSARFELPIIENVLAIIVRDFQDALDYFYAADTLPDFAERSIGTNLGLNFPILVIGPRTNPVETADDKSYLTEPMVIEIELAVSGKSGNDAMYKVMKYVRAMDAVLRTATYADYFQGFDTGASQPFGLSIDVGHEYGPLLANDQKTIYSKPARLDLRLTFNER